MNKSNTAIKEVPYGKMPDHELQGFVGPHGAAKFMGVPVSWIYERTSKGSIPHYKIGKYLKFDLEELKQYVKSCRVK